MLELKDICKRYVTQSFTQVALDSVSLSFRDNEFVAILGPSGSGKTTMLNVIGGLDHFDSGDLLIDVLPGWSIVNENTSDHKVVRKAHIPSPLIFMGSGVKPAVINTPVTIDHIAPTVAHILRIRSPNACSATPITDIR